MTDIAVSPEALQATIAEVLGAKAKSVTVALLVCHSSLPYA